MRLVAWVRIHDGAMTHPKVVGLIDWRNPFCVWVWGLSHCQQHLTNGNIRSGSLPTRAALKTADRLVQNGLWHKDDNGDFIVHDYLDWNDSRAAVLEVRQLAKVRMILVRDPEMRDTLRQRDQDRCRYCGVSVNWADRKSRGGATYDHINPHGPSNLDNLVIACRGCNSRKQKRLPHEAGMVLLPPPQPSVSRFKPSGSGAVTVESGLVGSKLEREFEGKPNGRSRHPVFSGQRLTVFDWMVEDCAKTLGNYTEQFDLHDWFFTLDARAVREGIVIPKRDGGAWLQSELVAEAQRRRIPLRLATVQSAGKQTTRLASALAKIAAEEP